MSKKKLLLFFFFVVIAVLLMTYQAGREPFRPLSALSYAINAANDAIDSILSNITTAARKMQLTDEENKKLQEEINKLIMEQQENKEMLLENSRLREILNLKQSEKKFVAAARVIARGSQRWSNTLLINKGARDGITKDMAVITPKGLAGKILSADKSYSTVLLLNDVNFSAAARLEGSRTEGITSGSGGNICLLKYITYDYEVEEDEIVITSGLDSMFPENIPIGTVTKIVKDSAGIFQYIEVTPFQDIHQIEEVVVVNK